MSPLLSDPFANFVLCGWLIVWSIWGYLMIEELFPIAPSRQWRAYLLAFAGPVAWGVYAYRGILAVRHKLLARMGLPTCGCCGNGYTHDGHHSLRK